MNDEGHPKASVKSVPIKWDSKPTKIQTRYATNMTVQHGENEFFLAFYEMRPPILIGDKEEVKQQVESIDHIEAECVARIVISAEKMPKFILAMQQNHSSYVKNSQNEEESKD